MERRNRKSYTIYCSCLPPIASNMDSLIASSAGFLAEPKDADFFLIREFLPLVLSYLGTDLGSGPPVSAGVRRCQQRSLLSWVLGSDFGRTARCGLSLEPFRHRRVAPLQGAAGVRTTTTSSSESLTQRDCASSLARPPTPRDHLIRRYPRGPGLSRSVRDLGRQERVRRFSSIWA
jgi:hypothetical protein